MIAASVVTVNGVMPVVGHAATNIAYAPTTILMTGQTSLRPQHVVSNDPWSGRSTSWVPVDALQEALKSVGVQTTWNGNTLNVSSTPSGWKVNVSSAPQTGTPPEGQMQFSIGGNQDEFVRAPKLVEKDPSSDAETTYIPVYYADLFLRQRLLMSASWSGGTPMHGSLWSMTPQKLVSNASSNGISEHTYSSSTAASNVITSLQQGVGLIDSGWQSANLGSGINAKFVGGAGQYRYQWQEGKWTVITLFYGSYTSGTQVAKNVVSYLNTHMLPAPDNKGVIIIMSSSTIPKLQSTIAWQVGSKVYKLQQMGDPVKALETVVNSTHS